VDRNDLHVIVVGGGLGGLAATLLLARRGHRVTLVERDADPPRGGPDQLFSGWARPGVPQARHPHNFLARSVRVLRDQAPDVLESLESRGVLKIPVDLGDGPADALLCSRRPVYEAVVRQALTAEPTVTVRAGATVTDLVVRPGQVPVVEGVVIGAGETIRASLVVDAAGRRTRLSAMLEAHGARPAPATTQGSPLMYISRYYRLRPGHGYPRLDSPVLAFIGWARSMAFLGDNRTFALLATIVAGDPLRRRLTTEAGFHRFHSAVPVIRPWLAAGEPISPIRVMARLENSYRRLADGDGPVAGGVVLLGDSCMHTNPTAGRGVSLAFAQAERLALTIGGATDPLAYTAGFDGWTDAHIGVWYGPQAQADAALARRIQAAVAGQPAPALDPAERLRSAVFHAARTDADIAVALRRMLHLVARPGEVLGNPAVVSQLGALVNARPELTAVAAGPTREELAA
jgi:2-polyprenyl-6-methoxyphenol hydroxylase-like FAD-dependent oxidoreductase